MRLVARAFPSAAVTPPPGLQSTALHPFDGAAISGLSR